MRVALAAAVLLLAAGPAAAQTGERLYQRDCLWCHGPQGQGTARGPSLADVGEASAYYWLSTGRMPIDEPREAERGEVAYDDAELEALVGYVAALGEGPALLEVHLPGADLASGETLYRRYCAACHGFAGSGGPLAYGRTSPSLDRATPAQAVAAMLVGPGRMPVFGPPVLTEEQLRDVAAYVDYLRAPTARGGHGLFGIGPVVEAALAGVAILGLIALVRWGIGPEEDE